MRECRKTLQRQSSSKIYRKRRRTRQINRNENNMCELQVLKSALTEDSIIEWWSRMQDRQGNELSKLHHGILRFSKLHDLTPQQALMREQAVNYIRNVVHQLWPNAEVQLFGSTFTGLALPWSDIDISIMSPTHDVNWQKPSTRQWLSALVRLLQLHGNCLSLRPIPFAKVPILKLVFQSGLACDIAFDVYSGVCGASLICGFVQRYHALGPLCLVLKSFLGQCGLNEVYKGGIGSFCLINLIVSHLEIIRLQGFSGNFLQGHDLGTLLLSFFMRYSSLHNYSTNVVCLTPENSPSKQARGWVKQDDPELLAVEDPLDPANDIGRATYRIIEVRNKFSAATRVLMTHWLEEEVLSSVMNTSVDFPNVEQTLKKKRNRKKKKIRNDALGINPKGCGIGLGDSSKASRLLTCNETGKKKRTKSKKKRKKEPLALGTGDSSEIIPCIEKVSHDILKET